MLQSMRVTTNSVRNMVLVPSNGPTVQHILASSTIIISMAKVYTLGQTVENTKVNGEPIRCTAKEHSHGPMEENI